MDRFKVSSSRVSGWESNNGCLSNFTQRPGWVVGHSATGNGAWAPINAEVRTLCFDGSSSDRGIFFVLESCFTYQQ